MLPCLGWCSCPHAQIITQGQQLPEYQVSGLMNTDDGPQPPATQQMSFEFPVEIPGAPPPPGPNIITVGPRPLKTPICKECIKQRKMIKKLVDKIEQDNDKAKDIQEQQDDMIESYRTKMEEAIRKMQDRLFNKGRKYRLALPTASLRACGFIGHVAS